MSVIRGVEITHRSIATRIRAIVSRSRSPRRRRPSRARSSSRASSPPHRASARPRTTRRGVTFPRDARPIVRTKTSPRAPVRETKPRDRRCSRAVASPRSRLASSRARTDSINSAPDRSPGAPGRRRRPMRVVVVAGGSIERETSVDVSRARASPRERARADRRRARGSSDARRRVETREEARRGGAGRFRTDLTFERDELLARERRAR